MIPKETADAFEAAIKNTRTYECVDDVRKAMHDLFEGKISDKSFDDRIKFVVKCHADKEVEPYVIALKICIAALYEAHDIAPLDRIPPSAGEAIQLGQYLLETFNKN